MKNTLNEIRALWQKDKEDYRTTEVGSGVQSFVKKILESELFSLTEGKLSTKLENRKNEFIYEKKAKESRKADFYIYINSDIAIPVEVECYGNIKAGETQLFNYQKDFDKHYGILTDGFTWRFYNNNIFKTFTLDDLLANTQLFSTFWKEYVKPEFYYLSFFERVGQLALIEETKLRVEDNRQLFFEDITKLIQSFKNKLQIEGYVEASDKKEKEKRAIELTYAYIIQFILYKTLVDNDFDDFGNKFETIVKKIFEFLKEQRYKDILGIIEGISTEISKNIYHPFIKEQDFIKDKIQELYHSLENNLSDISPWLDIFIFIKKYNFANVKNEIFGYIYENYLKELYGESKKGQYFTDPAVVNFMLEQVGYTPETVSKRYASDKDSISIIDPSCGSGTFLYSATDSIVKGFKNGNEEASKMIEEAIANCVFGLDIEEFPLYLAEMNILMRMLPLIINENYNNPIDKKIKVFKTRDSISEFRDTALRNTFSDHDIEYQKAAHKAGSANQIRLFTEKLNLGYSSYVRDEDDLKEMKKSLENHSEALRRRFDYVIGNPPYISYNECSKQNVMIVKLIQDKKALMSDIYGVNLNTVPQHIKPYAPKPNLYAFFIALGLALLKDRGLLSYIIPQTVLVNTDLDVIRYHLAKYTTIKKIITFRSKMFTGRGLAQKRPVATSSLIFIVERKQSDLTNMVEVVNHLKENKTSEESMVDINSNKNISRKFIMQNDFLVKVDNWNFIKWTKKESELMEEYKRNTESLDIYRDYSISKERFGDIFIIDGSINIMKKDLIENLDSNIEDYYTIYTFGHNYSMKPIGYYPKSKKIKIAKGSQGLIVIPPRFKVFWKYINHDHFYFAEGENILPIYQQYCITSNNKNEILFLLSIFNSSTISFSIDKNLKVTNEDKLSLLFGLRVLKKFVRVPKITDTNKHLKSKVINLTEQLLNLEKLSLADLVNFSGVLTQKFDKVDVDGEKLILKKDGEILKLPIKNDSSLVSKIIKSNYNNEELELDKQVITLSELMSLPIIDSDKQKEIKDHIDNLVFSLYFNVDIPKDKISDTSFVKYSCVKNKYYTRI